MGCARLGAPGAEALEQLHAAEREGERARIAGDVLVERPRIEQRDCGVGQRVRGVQRQRQTDRAGADHGKFQRRRFVHARTPVLGIVFQRGGVLFAAPGCPGSPAGETLPWR